MKCRLCASEHTSFLFYAQNRHGRRLLSNEQFAMYLCGECKVVFTDVPVDQGYYAKYYLRDYYNQMGGSSFSVSALALLKKISFKRKQRLILRHKPEGNRILEIGCARGEFLQSLPRSFKKYGIEINKEAARYIKEHYPDITVYDKGIEEGVFDDSKVKFDIIVMWHVFEHIENPASFIQSLSNFLAENGVIIFEVPNRDSIGFHAAKSSWFHLDAPRHLFHFNLACLKRLFEKSQLRIVAYSAPVIDYFQDLAVSMHMKLKTRNLILNILIDILVIPPTLLVRTFAALCVPRIAEVNTYIVRRSA